MRSVSKRCLLLATVIVIVPPAAFLSAVGLRIPPDGLWAWLFWIAGTIAGWTAFLAALAEFTGYDLRSVCSPPQDARTPTPTGKEAISPRPTPDDVVALDAAMLSTSPQTLRRLLVERLDYEELRTLCFDVNIDFDSLRGEGKAGKARELVAHFQRRDRLSEFATSVCHFLDTRGTQ